VPQAGAPSVDGRGGHLRVLQRHEVLPTGTDVDRGRSPVCALGASPVCHAGAGLLATTAPPGRAALTPAAPLERLVLGPSGSALRPACQWSDAAMGVSYGRHHSSTVQSAARSTDGGTA
jgi:hypothetical protein